MTAAVRLFFLLAASTVAAPVPDGSKASARALGNAFASVYEKVAPSVVVLEVTKQEGMDGADAMAWDFFFQNNAPQIRPRLEESEGSGFIIREDGYILTNAHVVEGADWQRGVVARMQDGSRLPVTIVGIDDKTDIAVLKADAKSLPPVEWGDSDALRVGEFVCGIGAPFELDYSLTVGVLSAKGRSHLTEDTVYEDYLQTDTAINPGNSGGPLCDLDGRIIGVNTLINGYNRGLSFAIPAKLARQISDELIANGRVVRPWIGVRITTLGDDPGLQQVMGLQTGVLVKTIEPDAPASRSELQPADVIVAVDGLEVGTARELQQAILRKEIGQKIELKVWRRGARAGSYRKVDIVTGELPAAPSSRLRTPRRSEGEENGGSRAAPEEADWGLELAALAPAEARDAGVSGGVRVVEVDPGSPAAVAGIEPGDIVTAIGSDAVTGLDSFASAMAAVKPGEAAVLMVERGGKKTYAILKR